ncbi:MAG: hypothetical protein GX312_05180, partial [Candidatus Phytoplasma sp.]|nr:hypothetical protein [Phytoplasma sp.]
MKKLLKTRLKYLVFTLLAIVFIAITPVEVHAGEFDHAKTFYDKNASKVVFYNGYFYYAVSGRKASSSTIYATIGLQMRISNSAGTAVVKFKLGGGSMVNISQIQSGSYEYNLFRVPLNSVKTALSSTNSSVYNRFIVETSSVTVDSIMTVKEKGTQKGDIDDNGNLSWGEVYYDAAGIKGARAWSKPSDLDSYFNKYIDYRTSLHFTQTVYVRYQNASGGWGGYSANYYTKLYGDTMSWSRAADTTYNAASIASYTVTSANTRYVDVSRRTYRQVVYVRYQNASGGWGGYSAAIDSYRYAGSTVSWSRGADTTYNAASLASYTVNGANTKYVDVSRRTYRQVVYVRYQNASGGWGDYSAAIDSYRYAGSTVSWSRGADTTYNAASLASYTVNGA